MTDRPALLGHAVLLPCEPCFGARIFGGRHECTGMSNRGLLGRRILPVLPEPCPCDHQQPSGMERAPAPAP